MPSTELPKAILYTYPQSVWASAALLALEEKGYGEDEIELKIVDVVKGDNYAPEFLRINPDGLIPTLVVPLEQTLPAEIETKYRAFRGTKEVLEFLDKGRSTRSKTHTTSQAPAPVLSPATVEGQSISNTIITLLHDPAQDPNFFLLSARSDAELEQRSASFPGRWLRNRHAALTKYLATTPQPHDQILAFLKKRYATNSALISAYEAPAGSHDREAFIKRSKEAWEVHLKAALTSLEATIVGPFVLGDQLSLADLHLIVWLARMVDLSGGDATEDGVLKLGPKVGPDFQVGPKTRAFWSAILARPSFQKVYKDGLF